MGHVLSLSDGSTTVYLTTSGVMLRQYVPRTPDIEPGGAISTVAEPIEVLIYGANESAVTSKIQAIEDLLARARDRFWTGNGPRVFLQRQMAGSATTNRSEIVNGSLELDSDALTAYGQYKVGCRIVVTRVGYWEGAITPIPLSNRNGSSNTSGLTVYDRGNGQDNWVGISSTNITGALPAPLELWMTNNTGGTRHYRNFRIANNIFSTTLDHIIEGETAPGITDFADSGSSGGYYAGFTGMSASFDLPIDAGHTSKFAGRRAHILARFSTLPLWGGLTKVWAQCIVMDDAGVTPLYTAPEVLVTADDYIQQLGTVPLPPTSYNTNGPYLTLRINILCSASASVGLDFVQLTPSDDLCYRHLIQRGYGAPASSTVVDNGIEGLAYLQVGGVNHPIFTARTQPVHVYPNRNQRIYILHDGDGTSVNWTLSVRAWYRPRIITL